MAALAIALEAIALIEDVIGVAIGQNALAAERQPDEVDVVSPADIECIGSAFELDAQIVGGLFRFREVAISRHGRG